MKFPIYSIDGKIKKMSQTTNQLLSTIAKLSTWWSQFNPNHRITTKWLPVLAPRGESPHQVYHLTRVKSPLAKSIFFVLKNPPPKHEMDGISPWNDDGNDDGNDGSKNSPPMMIFIILWNSQNKIHMFYDHRMKSIHKFPVKSQNVIGKSQKSDIPWISCIIWNPSTNLWNPSTNFRWNPKMS